MLSAKTDHINYLATIVRLPELRPHPNADRLALVTLQGQTIIVGKETAQPGELYVLFQLESKINFDFLAFTNNFSEPEKNRDKTKKGFFAAKNCRLKACRIRSFLSEEYLHPVSSLNEWLDDQQINYQVTEKDLGVQFDTINNTLFVEKYINYSALRQQAHQERIEESRKGKKAKESKIIDEQFRFHINTPQLKRFVDNIAPEDYVSISEKIHGTSAIGAHVLCKRKLSWKEKVAKFFGAKVQDTQYDFVISSRKVLKNCWVDSPKAGFYDADIWSIAVEQLKPSIQKGITLYFEIVGQLPTGSWIQNLYDYGCAPLQHNHYVYRITSTNVDGQVVEFTHQQIINYCDKFGLNHVPHHFYGKARDLFPQLDTENHWRENWLNLLVEKFATGNCFLCQNKVPREGIVVRKEQSDHYDVYKLKGEEFLIRESRELDSGEINIEDQELTKVPPSAVLGG